MNAYEVKALAEAIEGRLKAEVDQVVEQSKRTRADEAAAEVLFREIAKCDPVRRLERTEIGRSILAIAARNLRAKVDDHIAAAALIKLEEQLSESQTDAE